MKALAILIREMTAEQEELNAREEDMELAQKEMKREIKPDAKTEQDL